MTERTSDRDPFFDPEEGPPPRKIEPWTRVTGHQIISRRRPEAWCKCGFWRAATSDSSSDEHLRTAWPVLVQKLDGETFEGHVGRVEKALAQAIHTEGELDIEAGIHEPIQPGHAFPTITPEMVAAGGRVDVLQHQLEELRHRYPGWRDR